MSDIVSALTQTMPGMPPESWWLAPAVVALLGALAIVDTVSARVPDPIVLPGLLFVTAVQGLYVDWTFAGFHLVIAFVAGFTLYFINEIWYRASKSDALGMGDAKWTVLAVACFGGRPAFVAWIIGAWGALGWIGIARLAHHPVKRVHFTPFLFVGLLVGIYVLRLRG